VIGSWLQRIEKPTGTPQPSARDGRRAVEIELIDGKPRRHSGGARRTPVFAIQAVCALAGVECRLGVIEPPRRPAQPLERLRGLLDTERMLERQQRGGPFARLELSPPAGQPVSRSFVASVRHRQSRSQGSIKPRRIA
jgi:hypothetical protein